MPPWQERGNILEESSIGINIFAPKTVNEILSIKEHNPGAAPWAGGTAIMRHQTGAFPEIEHDIIQLSGVEELKKIRRTERYLEIGACVPVKKIINVGQHVLPFALAEALKSIASPHVRNLATLGGNICCRKRRLNTFGPLLLMDTIVELRKTGKSRWIQIGRINSITDTEILTRIRIPLRNWNLQYFKSFGDPIRSPLDSIAFTVLMETNKGIISSLRFAAGNTGKSVMRNMDFETYLAGRKSRLNSKEIETAAEIFSSFMDEREGEITPFQKDRTTRFIRWFLKELRDIPLFTE